MSADVRMVAKRWCFRVSNPVDSLQEQFDHVVSSNECHYIKLAEEVGEGGLRHFQGYLELKKPQRGSRLKKLVCPGVHVMMSFGTPSEASEYIGNLDKSGSVGEVLEYGKLYDAKPGPPKVKTDDVLWEIKAAIDNGKSLVYLYHKYFPYMVRHGGGVSRYYAIVHPSFPEYGREYHASQHFGGAAEVREVLGSHDS